MPSLVGRSGEGQETDREMRQSLEIIRAIPEPPARFEAYPPEVTERAYEFWSTIAGRSGARVVRLLAGEFGPEAPLPTAGTVNRWALEGAWGAKADADLERGHGRTIFQLQAGWLAGLQLAQKTLLDGMAGAFDALPMGGAGRIKSAEITLRVIERAGLLAILPQPPTREDEDVSQLSVEERMARTRRLMQELKPPR